MNKKGPKGGKRKFGKHPVLVLKGKSSGLHNTSLSHGGGGQLGDTLHISDPKWIKFGTGKVHLEPERAKHPHTKNDRRFPFF